MGASGAKIVSNENSFAKNEYFSISISYRLFLGSIFYRNLITMSSISCILADWMVFMDKQWLIKKIKSCLILAKSIKYFILILQFHDFFLYVYYNCQEVLSTEYEFWNNSLLLSKHHWLLWVNLMLIVDVPFQTRISLFCL